MPSDDVWIRSGRDDLPVKYLPYVIVRWRCFLDPVHLTLVLAIMGAPHNEHSVSPQWLFPIDALRYTPSVATSGFSVGKELYDRSRGVEFLFRLGSSLGLLAVLVAFFGTSNLIFPFPYRLTGIHQQSSLQQLGFTGFS